MRNAFSVKDVVVMKENRKERGTIVGIIRGGKYKILWDRDWHTGRTRVHQSRELMHISLLEEKEQNN